MRFLHSRNREGERPGRSADNVQHAAVGPVLDTAELRELSAAFAAPRWLRDLGIASWLLAGVAVLLLGVTWLLATTAPIVDPVLAAFVVAAVASPVVAKLQARRVPRAAGALLVLLAVVVFAVLVILLVIGGITSQSDEIKSSATEAVNKAQSWLEDVGVSKSGADSAGDSVKSATPDAISTLTKGVISGIEGIASLAFGLALAILSLFFLLKDGPVFRRWVDRHLGVPVPAAQTITGDILSSIRRYFLGVSIVAGFNALVVAIGALALGVPLAGTIAVVTFVTAFIPYVGAVVAGAFAVVLALGAEGTTTALIMLVIVLLANGLLQNIVQPIAFGATLDLNPLVVLIVTIGAGCLFGMVGLVLAAPLTSAAVHITADLARARARARPNLPLAEQTPLEEPAPGGLGERPAPAV
jgi:predicted PurR-regulated permease PerM